MEGKEAINKFLSFEKMVDPLVDALLTPPLCDSIADYFDKHPQIDDEGKKVAARLKMKLRESLPSQAIQENFDFFAALNLHVYMLEPLYKQITNIFEIVEIDDYVAGFLDEVLHSMFHSFALVYYLSLCTIARLYEGDEGEEAKDVYEYIERRIKQISLPWKIDNICVG